MVAFGEGEGRKLRTCIYSPTMGCTSLGVSTVSYLSNCTQVAVLTTDDEFDLIIAPVGSLASDAAVMPVDFAAQGAGAHFFTEDAFSFPATERDGVIDASQGGFLDAMPGEWGVLSEVGVGLFVGRYQAFLRANEMCGIWANYLTNALQLRGRDLQVQTYSREDHDGFTDGDMDAILKRAIFPNESVGMVTEGDEKQLPQFAEDTGRKLYGDPDGLKGPKEPVEPDNVLMPRIMTLEGLKADARQTYIVSPNQDLASYTQEEGKRYVGLMRERMGLDGSYELLTRSHISMRKVTSLPVPTDVQPIDHPAKEIGDSDIEEQFRWTDLSKTYGAAAVVAQAIEHHAFVANALAYRKFIGRSDWEVPEADAPHLAHETPVPPVDKASMWQKLPTVREYKLAGGRTVELYMANSGIDILPDGSVVIDGPAGEQIIMGGGNIVLSCPGSVYQLPGQHATTWAGGDIVQRAKKHVELSSTDESVRIKSEQDLMLLGANGGRGGVLIESKSKAQLPNGEVGTDFEGAGVTVKTDGWVNVDSRGTMIRADIDGIHMHADENGVIDLSCGYLLAEVDDSFALTTDGVVHVISKSLTKFDSLSVYLGGNTAINGALGTANQIQVEKGGMLVEGNLAVSQSIAASEHIIAGGAVAGSNGPFLGLTRSDPNGSIFDRETLVGQMEAILPDFDIGINAALVSMNEWWTEYYETIPNTGFSFRRDDDYLFGHDDFALPEIRWQSWFRQSGDATTWSEIQVAHPSGEPTMPHPGKKTWEDEGKILEPETGGYWDQTQLLPQNRDGEAADVADKPLSGFIINTN